MAKKEKKVTIKPAKGRPMLHWIGKRPLSRLNAFPDQVVETFGEKPSEGGHIYHGDNKEVLAHLLANGYRGKVDLIYIDPPFNSGADYVRRVKLRGDRQELTGENYTLDEQIQYTDIWANDNYLQFMYERLMLLKELLSESATFVLHCDSSKGHHLRCLLDEVFGPESFRNEIVWFYENKLGTGGSTFDSLHDVLLIYAKDKVWTHNPVLVPVKVVKDQPVTQKIDGKRVWLRDKDGNRMYQKSRSERPVGDVWTIPIINPVGSERTGYPTQKPESLIERIVLASSNPDDLILDCFIGSGTTAAVAQRLGRRWIGCDINKGAIQTTSKRLQSVILEQLTERERRRKEPGLIQNEEAQAKPAQYGFTVHRVNDYDLQIQHNEAVALACKHIGITRSRSDIFFDGTVGKRLVKVVPFDHPLCLLDLEELKKELEARPEEQRDIMIVALGKELAVEKWLEDWNRLRKRGDVPNKIEVVELRTDPKYGKFFAHTPATAKAEIKRLRTKLHVEIKDFISPTIIERLEDQSGVLKPRIDDWRAMIDCVMIDPDYDGTVFNVVLSDIPAKKADLVEGVYELDPPKTKKTTVAVKIIDMLGEEVLITKEV